MPTATDDLLSLPAFTPVARSQLQAAASRWRQVDLEPGRPLWEQGQAADGVAVLISGELSVEAESVIVGRVRTGELLGEASLLLASHPRTATLRALTRARVVTIDANQLRDLRAAGGPVYGVLLALAEHSLVRRIREANLRVAKTSTGTGAAPAREQRSALFRLWNALRPGLPTTLCPAIEPLLRVQPALGSAAPHTIAAIAKGFVQEAVGPGHVLFLEGEPGDAAWLLVEGEVEAWRNVQGGQAERLATLGPGRLLGVNALVEGGARTASCVTTTACWLYRADGQASFAHLADAERQAWRESVIGSLTAQIRAADQVLGTTRHQPGQSVGARAGDLLRATGLVDEIGELDLAAIEPLVSEAELRTVAQLRGMGD